MNESEFSIAPFLGAWELDPQESRYEMGAPPQHGSYELVPATGDDAARGEITVVMDWTDAAGKDFRMTYPMTPDGQDHPYSGSPAVDAMRTTILDARTLETVSKKDGTVMATGRRELTVDGKAMRVTQSGKTPDGSSFVNVALYRKRVG